MKGYDARSITQEHKQRILERDCYICAYCDGYASEVDHVVPWSWSKCDDDDNLVASCRDCNDIAWNLMFQDFSAKRIYIRKRRGGTKWKRKIFNRVSVCTNCKRNYCEGTKGATHFLCPECKAEEYEDSQ